MKKTIFYYFCSSLLVLLSACNNAIEAPDSIKCISPKNEKNMQLVLENRDIFVNEVPFFDSYEEMERALQTIADTTETNFITKFCKEIRICNKDIDLYIEYYNFINKTFGNEREKYIEDLDSDSEESYKCSDLLLKNAQEYNAKVHVVETKEGYIIEPIVDLDIRLLRNADDLLICSDTVYYFTKSNYYQIPIETFINNYENIQKEIAKIEEKELETEKTTEDDSKEQVRRISESITNKDGSKWYKLTAIFKTHYCHNIFTKEINMHNYVWVKNYKKIGRCYILKKFDTTGTVTFNLDWKDGNTPSYFINHDNFKIYTNGKHAEWKYRHSSINVYQELKNVTSNEYFISDLNMDISNQHNHMQYNYKYY